MQASFFMFQQIREMPMSDKVVNEQTFKEGLEAINLIRAICPAPSSNRCNGFSVRLVRPVE